MFSIALLFAGVAAVRGQTALDGFDPNANEQIFVIVVQPADGKILIGGRFTSVLGEKHNRLVRLNPDGTLDRTFKHPEVDVQRDGTVRSGTVYAIALQSDGRILVGGDFTAINGVTRNFIARLNSDGTLDREIDPNAYGPVLSIAVQTDDKILVGGRVGNNWFIRLNGDGTEDSTFNPDVYYDVRAIVLQPDGKILIGGDFTKIGGDPTRKYLARLNTNGTVDPTFNPNLEGTSQYGGRVMSIALQADGKILIGGFFSSVSGMFRYALARLNSDGTPDSFDPHPDGVIESIVVQADGRILVGGLSFTSIDKQSRNSIARLNPDGTADSFDPNVANVSKNPRVYSIAVQADGKILVGGNFSTLAPNGGPAVTRNHIARLEAEVRLDTLNLGMVGSSVLATAVQPDGKILIGGVFSKVLGVERNNIARLNTDGTLDLDFNPNANGSVEALAVQANGSILVGGDFRSNNGANSIGGKPRNRIARLLANGVADSFDPNAEQSVRCIAVQADGNILLGGRFTTLAPNGGTAVTRNYIARLKPDGMLDTAFNPKANGVVYSIAVQPDSVAVPVAERGKILVGGGFTTLQPNGATSATARHYLARLNPDGTLDTAFNPNANDAIFSIAVQADDGKVLAGGLFSGLNSIGGNSGETRNYIARLNIDGTLDNALPFNPDANNAVVTIAVQADRKIVVGGYFTGIGGQKRMGIARVNAVDGLADSFNPNANWLVYSIALQADGKVLAGGFFTTIDGQPRNLFARLTNDTAARQYLNVFSRSVVGWASEGSSPEVTRVTFESSTDNVDYTLLGSGTASGSRWVLEGLSLPTGNVYIRARGYYPSGSGNGSGSITESVRNAFIGVPPQCTPAPPGMVSWWPGDGKAVDIIGGNDGTLQGGATFAPGMVGQAFSFDGLDDFVRIPMNPSLFALTQGTLDMWVKINNLNDNTVRLFALAQSGTVFPSGDQWTLDYRGVGLLETSLTSGGSLVMAAFTSAIITDNNFHHIAVVADGVDPIEIYVDGVSVPVTSSIATTADRFFGHASNANNMAIGAISRDRVFAEGAKLIDEVEIFDRPLTQSEIQNIFNAGPAGKCKPPICVAPPADMVAWYPGEGDSKDIQGPTFENGTLQGGATFTPAKVGRGFLLNGTNAYVKVPASASLYPEAGSFTIDAWIRTSQTTGVQEIFSRYECGGDSCPRSAASLFELYLFGDKLSGKIRDTTAAEQTLIGTTVVADGNFHHVAMQRDMESSPKQFRLYVDGVLEARATLVATDLITDDDPIEADPVSIGAHESIASAPGGPIAFFSGIIDEVEYFNRALAGTEIAGIYNAGSAGKCKPPIHHLGNISTRLRVRTGDNVGIGGFTITGSAPKHVLLRAIGPSLAQLGVPNALADPVMELHGPTGFATITDDNWTDDSVQEALIRATGIPPTNNLESAIDATLAPGAYTAIIRGKGNTSGIASVEVYDLDHAAVSKLANISTRAFVSTGSDIVIAGFILESQGGNDRIVLRGIGPSLTALGLPNALANPTLELRDGNGALQVANDNWADDPVQAAQLTAAGLAPTNQLESAIAASLPAGLYTVLLAGKNNGAGVGLVEVYDLGTP
ncbi:MAG: LamG-like jellyroll fold domain-containing protein [Chthoniobacterales bacterium]